MFTNAYGNKWTVLMLATMKGEGEWKDEREGERVRAMKFVSL